MFASPVAGGYDATMRKPMKVWLFAAIVSAAVALPAPADETAEQAVWLLQKATLVHRNGFHNVLLSALRQMKDPKLEPLFSELIQRRHPGLKIHGILGMGEIADPPHLDLALLADIKEAGTQAQLVSAAIDSKLLTVDDARRVMQWPGLDPAVQVLVVGMLLDEGEKVGSDVLHTAMESENIAMRAMAALLLMQTGKPEAIEELNKLSRSDSPKRDHVRALVLHMAIEYDFANIGPWAAAIVREPDLDRTFRKKALLAALKFNADGATDLWTGLYDENDNEAERIRLAMLALEAAGSVDAAVFEKLAASDSSLLSTIGRIGRSLDAGKLDLEAVTEFVKINSTLAGPWALQYGKKLLAEDLETGRAVIASVIREADSDDPRLRARRLQHAVLGTQVLHEEDPESAPTLTQLFADASLVVREAMLIGLIRSAGDNPERIIAGVKFESRAAEAMALVLETKHAASLTAEQREALGLVVRGGGTLSEPLRIQAAWTYLKLTSQDRFALAKVLGNGGGS